MSTELLTAGADAGSAPRSARAAAWVRRHRLAIATAGLLVFVAFAADQWQQQRELDRMLQTMQSGEQQMHTTDKYVAGVIAYYSPLIFREAAPAGIRDSFQDDIDQGTGNGLAAIDVTSRALADIDVLPWHRHLRAARSAYQQRISQWQGYLATITDDADALFDPAKGFTDDAATTRAALLLAIPWTGHADERPRIEGFLGPARP